MSNHLSIDYHMSHAAFHLLRFLGSDLAVDKVSENGDKEKCCDYDPDDDPDLRRL